MKIENSLLELSDFVLVLGEIINTAEIRICHTCCLMAKFQRKRLLLAALLDVLLSLDQ